MTFDLHKYQKASCILNVVNLDTEYEICPSFPKIVPV